jgi:[acyl-carrier-protein] S-malonyltransferase
MLAYLFPGQGTQRTGMGQAVCHHHPEAAAIFGRANDVLGFDLQDVCFRGPDERLTRTEHAQPAVFTCGAAWLRVLGGQGLRPDVVAGHSVGELTAIHAAGGLDFESALLAVQRRAQLMAGTAQPGTMAAVLGLDAEVVQKLCEQASERGPVVVAVLNGPDHVVVSGAVAAVEECRELATAAGAVRVIPLAVSHAFHSPLMSEVVDEWARYVQALPMREPGCPVALNVTARLTTDVDALRAAMVAQVTGAVRWRECVEAIRDGGADLAVEVGDSKALTSFNRSIDRSLATHTMAAPGAVRQLVAAAAARRDDARAV